jgi:hypothetical protein
VGTALLLNAAATLLESAPFLIGAAVLLRSPLRVSAWMVPYLGCGCGSGPSARSLPAAAAACVVFGPFAAAARLAAAFVVERALLRRESCPRHADSLLAQLWTLVPLVAIGAVISLFAPVLFGAHVNRAAAFAAAALFGFAAAPCGIGTVALAAAMRATLPSASIGLLCVAGICDLRTWLRHKHEKHAHDALAYAIAALAFALVAAHRGTGLLNPLFAAALWPCAIAAAAMAYHHRSERAAKLRIAPLIMLAGAVLAAPPPVYHATETTLADAFPGERIDFTGAVTQTGNATTLVRYAITCCRADAAPIVIRLEKPLPHVQGWMHARGVLVSANGDLRLRASALQRIAPPPDPFVYR